MQKNILLLTMSLVCIGVGGNTLYAQENCEAHLEQCKSGDNCAPFGGRGKSAWDKCNEQMSPLFAGPQSQQGTPKKEIRANACKAGYEVCKDVKKRTCIKKCMAQPPYFAKYCGNLDTTNLEQLVLCVKEKGNKGEGECVQNCLK